VATTPTRRGRLVGLVLVAAVASGWLFGGRALDAVVAPGARATPGLMLVLMPVFARSPRTAPNFRRPVETRSPFTVNVTGLSSWRRFAMVVPAPRFTSSPRILSPTYER